MYNLYVSFNVSAYRSWFLFLLLDLRYHLPLLKLQSMAASMVQIVSQLKNSLRCRRRRRWNEGRVFQNIGGDNIRCTLA